MNKFRTEYFEMNRLDSTNSLNTDRNEYRQRPAVKTDGSRTAKADNANAELKRVESNTVAIALIASVAVIAAAAVIIGISVSDRKRLGQNFNAGVSSVTSVNDKEENNLSSEKVIGTGVLIEDCDILSEPDENSVTVGRLAGETDILVYAAEGKYYRISDANRLLAGYVLKEKVTGFDAAEEHS
ncbi:MAG: hypothetical protein IJM51_01290 [Clostridia bacterium]|nr:hypothetical protein [Clostridia bacterium]